MTHDDPDRIDPVARELIRCKACYLVGKAGLRRQDLEDLKQELVRRLLERQPAFDPDKADLHTFLWMLVERSAAAFLRERQARKRGRGRTGSLDVSVRGRDGTITELAQTVGQREYDARRGRHPRSEEELAQLALDVAAVLAGLPPELRQAAELLNGLNVSEAARALGVPRTTFYSAVRRLREHFERKGMRDYL